MGTYEITNYQWNRFKGVSEPGTNLPVDRVSWYEAAQFVNWLNTSTNNPVAYKFTSSLPTSFVD
jgi:formylglycine-generating enzyme required for sulfatase activity